MTILESFKQARTERNRSMYPANATSADISFMETTLATELALIDGIGSKIASMQNKQDVFTVEGSLPSFFNSPSLVQCNSIVTAQVDTSNRRHLEAEAEKLKVAMEKSKSDAENVAKKLEEEDSKAKEKNIPNSSSEASPPAPSKVENKPKDDYDMVNDFNSEISKNYDHENITDRVVREGVHSNCSETINECMGGKISDRNKFIDRNLNNVNKACVDLMLKDLKQQ